MIDVVEFRHTTKTRFDTLDDQLIGDGTRVVRTEGNGRRAFMDEGEFLLKFFHQGFDVCLITNWLNVKTMFMLVDIGDVALEATIVDVGEEISRKAEC